MRATDWSKQHVLWLCWVEYASGLIELLAPLILRTTIITQSSSSTFTILSDFAFIESFSSMFPKFLRVVTEKVIEKLVQFNETTRVWKKFPFLRIREPLDVIAETLGFSYEVVVPPDGQGYGERLPNGSWTKALGMIQRGEADLFFGSLSMTEEINEDFHLSYPFAVHEVTFSTRKPKHVPNMTVFLHPFSIQVWFSIIACVCLMPFIFQYLLRKKYSAVSLFTSALGPLVGQGIGITPQWVREYFVLASWILSSSLLYYFYAAVLLSFVTFPSMEGIRTIDDLANGILNGQYDCETYENAMYSDALSYQQNSSASVIGNQLAKSGGHNYFSDYFAWFKGSKKPSFVGLRSDFLTYKDFCFISEENFLSSFVAAATQKEFCCGSELDKVINRIWASKVFEKLLAEDSNYFFRENIELYGDILHNPPSEAQLTVTHLKGPFIFLIVSHSVAFLIFLIEVCVGKLNLIE